MGQHQGRHICLWEQFVGALHGEHLVKAGDRAAHRPLQPDGARGPQDLAQLGEGGTHMARARHQHCGPGQGLHIAHVDPAVIALLVPALGDFPIQGQEAGQHVLRHRLAVGAGGGGHQHRGRHRIGVLIRSRPHAVEPAEPGGLGEHLRPGPAHDDGGLGKLLRRGGAAARIQVDRVWSGGLKGGFFLLADREKIQNHVRHRKRPPYDTGLSNIYLSLVGWTSGYHIPGAVSTLRGSSTPPVPLP